MASSRKLQGEIERVLKQITEHMQEFDQIWQKVHSAPTPNLKEKYEGDLKKEIKKLQRFRDQIKSWAASNEIKNKKPLLDARKAIENEMERFKVLEKETKTKAYSKEGLNSSSSRGNRGKNGDGGDPREDPAKAETFAWLDEIEESLQDQLQEMDEKLEGLKASSKKKKSLSLDTQTEELQSKMARHAFHVETIQTIKDRLEHDELSVALVEDVHDSLEYYLSNNADQDFAEDLGMYDALELDKEIERSESREDAEEGEEDDEGADGEQQGGAEDEAAEDEEAPEDEAEAQEEEPVKATPNSKGGKAAAAAAASTAAATSKQQKAPASSPSAASTAVKGRSNSNASAAAAGPAPVVPTPTSAGGAGAGKGDTLASIVMKNQKQQASAAAPSPAGSPSPSGAGAAGPLSAADKKAGGKNAAAATAPAPSVNTASLDQFMADTKKAAPKTGPAGGTPTAAAAAAQQPSAQPLKSNVAAPVLPSIAPAQLGRLPGAPGAAGAAGGMKGAGGAPAAGSGMMPPPGLLVSQTPPPGLGGLGTGVVGGHAGAAGGVNAGSAADLSGLPSSRIGAGSSQLSAHKDRSLVSDDYLLNLSLLEPSLRNLPDPLDSDRVRQYIPRNPYRTPAYFPSLPAPIFDDPVLFDKLSVDSLFFIFYFQQGTPHQYLAARELKKQSWRYHKNFLTWFQRHDDPKITTEEYEQGTYVYFDYESGWCQRIKADFTFEYRHLEDELAVPLAATM